MASAALRHAVRVRSASDGRVALAEIIELKTLRGIALEDVLREVHAFTVRMQLPATVRIYLLQHMADIEYALAGGATESVQFCALIGAFQVARDMAVQAAV